LPVVVYVCETLSFTLRELRRLRVFESKVLRRIFGPKRDEITMKWKKLNNEELNDLYSSPIIFWMMKSIRMRWTGHVARMGERSVVYRILVWDLRFRDHLGDPGVDGRIILRRVFRK